MSPHWTLNQRVDDGQRPWLVLQTKHHRNDVGDLTPAEQDEMGRLIASLSRAIENYTGATRVYSLILNELGHVHIHLVPRYADEAVTGLSLPESQPPKHVPARLDDATVAAIAQAAAHDPGAEPHAIVRGVVRAHRAFDRHISPYRPASRLRWARRFPGAAFAPVYTGGWLVALLALLVVSSLDGLPVWLRAAIAAVAAFRWVDAVLYEVGVLLDRTQNWLSGFERSVVLAALNLAEISLIGAIWLLALEWDRGFGETWLHTVSLVTLSGTPLYTGAVPALAQVATLVGGIIFLAGAIALLLGAIGDRMREVSSP